MAIMFHKPIILIQLCIVSLNYAFLFPYVYPRLKINAKINGKFENPLILSPYIKNGSIELAQNLSSVSITQQLGFTSHSGFLTVDERFDSNLYFWYFPAFTKKTNSPVIIWLQGGPGGSSLYGLFAEIGPLIATENGFALRKYHWAIHHHLIFVDNPVGTGFSFTNSDKGYCKDENCIADCLFKFLKQFFALFPELNRNDFYVAGESYAGKYIPYLAAKIHYENTLHSNKIMLKGLIIGDGYCDPINQMSYGDYLYQHGLLDDNQLQIFKDMELRIVKEIQKENWLEADLLVDRLLGGELSQTSYFEAFTGFESLYNILNTKPENMSSLVNLLNNDKVRNSVHVGGLPFNSGSKVLLYLFSDILKSAAPIYSKLLSHYKIIFYTGQLDIVVAYPLTQNFLRNLNFSSAGEYKKAPRRIWRVDNEIAGFVKSAGNLTEVVVRNAGHMVPIHQPKWALDLIRNFIKNKYIGD